MMVMMMAMHAIAERFESAFTHLVLCHAVDQQPVAHEATDGSVIELCWWLFNAGTEWSAMTAATPTLARLKWREDR